MVIEGTSGSTSVPPRIPAVTFSEFNESDLSNVLNATFDTSNDLANGFCSDKKLMSVAPAMPPTSANQEVCDL